MEVVHLPQNRRSNTRYSVTVPAEINIHDQTYERTLVNLSLGGAFIEHDQRVGIGTRVHLSFRIPNREQPVEVGARVRWTAEDGVGVQFDGLRAGEVWSINQFLSQLS